MPGTLDAAWSRLTGAIIQLQTSIHAYKSSQEHPSQYKFLEIKNSEYPTQHTTESFAPQTGQATTSLATCASLNALEAQLASFEQQLKQRRQWRVPPYFSPDPFLLIDLSDLDDAIHLLESAIDIPRFPQRAKTPHDAFSKQRWEWDFQWSEWYYEDPTSRIHVYLTEWELRDDASEWQIVAQGHKSVEESLATLGSWVEWVWDQEWGEWYLPLIVEDDEVTRRRIYACHWKKTEEGNWVYVERRASTHEDN
ncbi:uncharacterized protein N0V89_004109 [Didymosphaeria variabile]|uniref:Uncharacterized protein n=1 Tax=Didymosphaeria variabile TaxID=1932322 RepID=A0A9W9CD51_9PLEO|nr:uncharacterized protein N0V89_004109 [Didymosphaeria variabile]KAJ4356082.1 hypothetical protein N0V89_004109 [Didymosphaeria variabile]